jgi:hypothetical protein
LTDDGAAINKQFKTKEFDLKEFNIEKIFQFWNIQLGGIYGVLTVNLYVDGTVADSISFSSGASVGTSDGVGTSPVGTFVFGLEGNYTESSSTAATVNNDWRWHTLNSSPSGTTFQLEFTNNTVDENFEIKQANIAYLPLPAYKRSPDREV